MINLNETGAFLWNFFTAEHTVDEAVAALCAEYEVEEERARLDAEKFADILSKNNFLE
jgi:hypothetical protein